MKSFHRRTPRPAPEVPSLIVNTSPRQGLRADALLVEQGLAASRTQAQRLIAAGRVRGPDGPILKSSQELVVNVPLQVAPDMDDRYVSRGGLKLAGALVNSGLSASGAVCLDVGQSTGGFTDCLLQAGATKVVGVDVGHGQLHPRLLSDFRVVTYEGINCRALTSADLERDLPEGGFDLIVGDVSFISLTLILPQLPALLATDGQMLLLVKPQFEVGPGGIGKGGIVRDPVYYTQVEERLRQCCAHIGQQVLGWFESAITGGDGNREFFIWTHHAS